MTHEPREVDAAMQASSAHVNETVPFFLRLLLVWLSPSEARYIHRNNQSTRFVVFSLPNRAIQSLHLKQGVSKLSSRANYVIRTDTESTCVVGVWSVDRIHDLEY